MKDHGAIISGLREALRKPLPGYDGFLEKAGYSRSEIDAAFHKDASPKQSAVLVLLFPRGQELHTLLMLRPDYAGVHSGQVSFPGGRCEPTDADHWATALREFKEETGIVLDRPEALGNLSKLYIPPSRSLVYPCVAFAQEIGQATPDPREVVELFEVPVDAIMGPDVVKHREQFIAVANRPVMVPYFDLGGKVVWGATAMMLWELRETMRALMR